jgi:quercetin dioxygenase-like cupin family protein
MLKRTRITRLTAALAAALAGGLAARATFAGAPAEATPQASLKWTDAGIPGVSTAQVRGEMAKGPSHFYLRYAGGFAAPRHHHSPDHYATTVSGTLVLVVDGREQRLGPGSYFAFTNKAVHSARCDGKQDCVMFIDARGPWDVVADK